jgi:hypothetical protein
MTYYEEDAEDWIERVKTAVDNEKPMYIPAKDKSQERHTELMEMLGAIFVQLSRVYDVLLINSEYRESLNTKHAEGELFAPPPNLKEEAWNETVQNQD